MEGRSTRLAELNRLLEIHDINLTDEKGCNALIVATAVQNIDFINRLVEFGSKLGVQDENGYTAITIALDSRFYKCTEILAQAGADPEIPNNDGL